MKMLHLWTTVGILCTAATALAGTEMGGGGSKAQWKAIFESRDLYVEAPMVTFDTGEAGTVFSSVTQICVTRKDGQELLRNLTPFFRCDSWGRTESMSCATYSRQPTYLERSRKQIEPGCETGQHRSRGCSNGAEETLIPLRFKLNIYSAPYGGNLSMVPIMAMPYDLPDCE